MITLEAAVEWRQRLRGERENTLAVTNGCFDVLHRGHMYPLLDAHCVAEKLLVLVNDDESVRALKGPGRPIMPAADRAWMLACLQPVDVVVIFSGTDCADELRALAPDVYVKSREYAGENQHEGERLALEEVGATTIWSRPVDGYSSTALFRRIVRASIEGGARNDMKIVPKAAETWGMP